MEAHVRAFAPRLAAVIGEAGVREFVNRGLGIARGYRFTLQGNLRFYLELMLAFGSGFDTDPQIPWAKKILTSKSIRDEVVRADRLYSVMSRYLDRVAGPDNEYAINAIRRLTTLNLEQIGRSQSGSANRAISVFQAIYPEKAEQTDQGALMQMHNSATAATSAIGAQTGVGPYLISGLMIGFGHAVLTDCLYPWVRSTLENDMVPNPDHRIDLLYKKTKVYAQAMLDHLNGDGGSAHAENPAWPA